jgi:hypothetical protein
VASDADPHDEWGGPPAKQRSKKPRTMPGLFSSSIAVSAAQ